MYIIFAPNKNCVQFQIIDYLGNSTDLYVVFTPKLHFSLRKWVKKQQKQEPIKSESGKSPIKLKDLELDLYFPNKNEIKTEPDLSLLNYEVEEASTPSRRFNLISLPDTNTDLALAFNRTQSEANAVLEKKDTPSWAYFSKYTPLTWLLAESSELYSRYAAGLLHKIYLTQFEIPEQLNQLEIQNGPGFDLMTYFYALYFLPFVQATSLDNLAGVNSREFAVLINQAGKPSPDAIRKFWNRVLDQPKADQFAKALYYQINHLDPGLGYGLYIDEHLVVYQGQKKMAKGKGGGGSQFLKGFYRYALTCALLSIPLYTVAKEGRTRLEPLLFTLIAEYETCSGKKVHLLIFDRGIKSFKTLKRLDEAGYYFICWSFPYSTVEKALYRRKKLKFVRISEMLSNYLKIRQKGLLNRKLTPEARALRQFLEACLPEPRVQAKLQVIQKKEAGEKVWNDRDFPWVRDTQIPFAEYGILRTIIVERVATSRLGIFTNIPSTLAHSIEVLELLKRKQHIENYYKYKEAIQGDYVPSWRLNEAPVQKTALKALIQEPDWRQLESYQHSHQKSLQQMKKIETEYKNVKALSKTGAITKRHFNQQEKALQLQYRQKERAGEELKAFIDWGTTGTKPRYFDQFEPILELASPLETLLNVINDLYFVNSRRIATDWANALTLAKERGDLEIPASWIKKIANLTPFLINDLFVKGGGKIRWAPPTYHELIVELHTELVYKGENLIAYYLAALNASSSHLQWAANSTLGFKLQAHSDQPQKLAKII